MSCLIDELKAIPDHRKARGKRHPLWVLLLLILMGTMAGYRGYHSFQTFTIEYNQPLSEILGIELNGIPSFSTVRQTMMEIDLDALSDAFEMWMLQHPELLSLGTGAWRLMVNAFDNPSKRSMENICQLDRLVFLRVNQALF